MSPARRPTIAWTLALTGLLAAGCAQPGPLLSRRTTVGSLKASVSQLEFERDQLRRQVADLRDENRKIEDRLAQSEATNDDLATRLDDAKGMLRGRGYDDESLAMPSRPATEPPSGPRTTPAARPSRRGRKPPFARIPGQIEPAEPSDSPGAWDESLDLPPSRTRDDFGPQGRLEGKKPWLPVAAARPDFGPVVR